MHKSVACLTADGDLDVNVMVNRYIVVARRLTDLHTERRICLPTHLSSELLLMLVLAGSCCVCQIYTCVIER